MDETKKILRSLLVSSPMVLTVMKLNNDYRDVMGYEIPYKDLGYEKLLDFLNEIPDVLKVNGNSLKSEISLVVSEKTAHVNDMVLRQKKGKSQYGFKSNRRKVFNGQALGRLTQKVNLVTSPIVTKFDNETGQYEENHNAQNLKHIQFQSHNSKYNKAEATNQNELSYPKRGKTNYQEKLISEEQPRAYETPKKNTLLRRLNYNDKSHCTEVLSKNNTDLKKCEEVTTNKNSNKDLHYLRRLNYEDNNSIGCPKDFPSLINNKIEGDKLIKTDTSDFMRQLLLQKYSSRDFSQENSKYVNDDHTTFTGENKLNIKHTEGKELVCRSKIPKQVQDDLKNLIEVFPKGIWCSQLPDEYKKKFRRELCFEKFGYRCLINMCMDLDNIFHCNKESTCDFKLYDARKQIPIVQFAEDKQVYSGIVPSFEQDKASTLPPLDWNTYAQLFPKDAVGIDVEIKRDFVSQSEVDSNIFRVVVAEIYDPSKFWLFRDDGKLDALMDEMQLFYNTNKDRYRIPEQFLEIGLYCVAVVLKEFHRCVIVKIIPDFNYVHVFYIDYGTLGTVPKNEVWFLKKDFAGLPAQAIRARLANICPPIEFAMWTSEARGRFQQLADMKHLEAKITNVSREKKIIEVCVENPKAAPGRDIGSILVDEGHAVYANQVREMNIHDSNCTPRVKFVHLFPDFEEIEYWLAPSIEEMAWFSNTDLTADFYFPQYFSRSIDKSLHDNIEIQAKKLLKKNEKPIKDVDLKDLETFGNMKDVLKLSYGDLYEKYKDKLSETVEDYNQYFYKGTNKSTEKINEENELELTDPDCEHYQKVVSKLRRKFLDSNVPQYTTSNRLTHCESQFSTATEEKDYKKSITKKIDDSFKDFSRANIIPRKNNSRIDQLRGQLGKLR
ncbi:hypothetical protein WA026_013335 [Henosepilachna vigintioctopunctata]|uniref:Tudor domain-containing protein 5 n=1 Tax=Henosepilachna vigintioctopunctata TaxID=420089 RepID=A0AAW1VFR8_9CUCU